MDGVLESVQGLFKEQGGLRRLLEALAQAAMSAEVSEHLGAEPHERAGRRRGHRNGYKGRTLATRVGGLELSVPQVRGCEPYHPSLFNRWQRSERALLVACAEMYFQGVSTRKVQEVLESMCQGEVSAMTVSRVASELDEKLSAFRARRLDGESWPYLMIDARYEKVRVDGRVVSQWQGSALHRRCWWWRASPRRAGGRCWTGVWATARASSAGGKSSAASRTAAWRG